MKEINGFLKQNTIRSEIGDIFWVRLSEDLLSDIQSQHSDCQPYVFALELGTDWIKLEFLIRSLKDMGCGCQSYCTPQQRDFILNFAHKMIEDLDIRT